MKRRAPRHRSALRVRHSSSGVVPFLVILSLFLLLGVVWVSQALFIQLSPQLSPADQLIRINVDFGNLSTTKTGGAATGSFGDYWNAGNDKTVLKLTSGSTSQITLSVKTLGGLEISPDGRFAINDSMMNSYSYNDHENLSRGFGMYDSGFVTLTNLSAGSYDLYLYGLEGQTGDHGLYNVSTSTSYGTKETGTTGDPYTSTSWQEGVQYVRYTSLIVDATGNISIAVLSTGAGHYPVINGLQLVQTSSLSSSGVQCVDSDNGLNYSLQGSVLYLYTEHTANPDFYGLHTSQDQCMNATTLLEFSCDYYNASTLFPSVQYTCPNGCSNGACLPVPTPLLLNVDFGNLSTTKTGGAATGSFGDYWNSGDNGILTFANGSSSSIRLTTTNLGGSWTSPDGRFAINDSMMNSYSYNNRENLSRGYGMYDSGLVTLTNLSVGSYDLYLYGFEGENGYHGKYTISVSSPPLSISYGTKETGTAGDPRASPSWQEGVQYVKYSSVIVGADGKLSVSILSAGQGNTPVINGLQLIRNMLTTVPLQAGWNFIGTPACSNNYQYTASKVLGELVSTGKSCTYLTEANLNNGSQPRFYSYTGGGSDFALSSSAGYFVNCSSSMSASTWTPSCSFSATGGTPPTPNDDDDDDTGGRSSRSGTTSGSNTPAGTPGGSYVPFSTNANGNTNQPSVDLRTEDDSASAQNSFVQFFTQLPSWMLITLVIVLVLALAVIGFFLWMHARRPAVPASAFGSSVVSGGSGDNGLQRRLA